MSSDDLGVTFVCAGFAGGTVANEEIAAHLRVSPPPDYGRDAALCMEVLEARTDGPAMVLPTMHPTKGEPTGEWSVLFVIGENFYATAPAKTEEAALHAAVHYVVVQRVSQR